MVCGLWVLWGRVRAAGYLGRALVFVWANALQGGLVSVFRVFSLVLGGFSLREFIILASFEIFLILEDLKF